MQERAIELTPNMASLPIRCSAAWRYLVSIAVFLVAGVGFVHAQPPKLPNKLPGTLRGEAAIAALGAHLPSVAEANGLDAQGLVTLFQTQRSLGVDPDGALVFTCDAPVAL